MAFDLSRFVAAQQDVYAGALAEIVRGRKVGHWMWFVFPQVGGLGQSAMSRRYAISSLDEARAYLAHPVLGRRLRECAAALLALGPNADAEIVFGPVDARKLRSSMTLFLRAATGRDAEPFRQVLDRYFQGEADERTDDLLAALPGDGGSV
jgi:uncharacterized protein (DUF1810 family)